MKFRPGDIIIGNQLNKYPITGRITVCEVVKCYNNIDIQVRVVGFTDASNHEEFMGLEGGCYTVESGYLDIFEECVI